MPAECEVKKRAAKLAQKRGLPAEEVYNFKCGEKCCLCPARTPENIIPDPDDKRQQRILEALQKDASQRRLVDNLFSKTGRHVVVRSS